METNICDGFEYHVQDDGKAITVCRYVGDSEDVVVPAQIDGLPVEAMSAFISSHHGTAAVVKRVTVSEGIKNVGFGAFYGYTSLESIAIPASVTEFDTGTLGYCASLEGIAVSGDNAVYCDIDGVVYSKDKTKLVFVPAGKSEGYTIPSHVTEISYSAFDRNTRARSMTIPGNVSIVNFNAFNECDELESVTIQDGVATIRDGAFNGCDALRSVCIPASVTEIDGAFRGCDALGHIAVAEGNPVYADIDGVLYSKDKTELHALPQGRSVLAIPEGVTSIRDCAFKEHRSLTRLTIPKSVVRIGEAVFANCNALEHIAVDKDNPAYCDIDGVLFNKGQTEILRFPNARKGIYHIPDGVYRIGDEAFFCCYPLTTVTTKGDFAKNKYDCGDSDLIVILPDGLKVIGDRGFAFCGVETLVLPDGLTTIGYEAFWEADMTDLTLPDSVTDIDEQAFYICEELTDEAWEKIRKVNPKADSYGENTLSIMFGFSGGEDDEDDDDEDDDDEDDDEH
jgi:hypothetical protein